MGKFIGEDDVQIPALFALMNERFAPKGKKVYPAEKSPTPQLADGITEMVELQKKFNIFRTGEGAPTFRECAALLNLGGPFPWSLRKRWYDYLDWLHTGCTSEDDPSIKGGEAICAMLRKNLAGESPKPVFFMPYLYEADPPKPKVLIDVKSPGKEPLFYIKEYYWVIQLPMKPE